MLIPFDAAELINGLIRTHKLNEWAKSIMGLGISSFVAFSYAMGTALMAGSTLLVGLGAGLVAGATAAALQARTDDRLKGLQFTIMKGALQKASDFQGEKR